MNRPLRPGRAQQAGRARAREPKMQPAVKRPNPARTVPHEFANRLLGTTFGQGMWDVLIARTRESAQILTNVPQEIVFYSTSGRFDVGLLGGPSMHFALNILRVLLPLGEGEEDHSPVPGVTLSFAADLCCMPFCQHFLVPLSLLPGETATITEQELRAWVDGERWRWQ